MPRASARAAGHFRAAAAQVAIKKIIVTYAVGPHSKARPAERARERG